MDHRSPLPTLLVAGTHSGVGKTTLVSGLLAAFRRRGLRVQPFKCGPDYIDPGHHTRAAGRTCRNLDSWMLSDDQVRETYARACLDADLAIIEGVMGLHDGSDFTQDRASAAQIAKLLGAPVLLVLDISGAARSAAAMAQGYLRFDPELPPCACALNFAGSKAHAEGCAGAITSATGAPVLGFLTREALLQIPERHLGLRLDEEGSGQEERLQALADLIEQQFDLEALLSFASRARGPASDGPATVTSLPTDAAPVLAIPRDEAFAFYYPDNLELLERAGARLAFFSPLRGEAPPDQAAGVYLGGGYPELHARALSENLRFRQALRRLHAQGAPLYAECGGFMVLTEALVDTEGRTWPMAGLVPGITRMTTRLAGLGYRHATARVDTPLCPAGTRLRGHEFHYSQWEVGVEHAGKAAWDLSLASKPDQTRPDGYADRGLLASYLHLPFAQDPTLATHFVSTLRAHTPLTRP